MNHDLFADDDFNGNRAYAAAGVAIANPKGYRTANLPSTSSPMKSRNSKIAGQNMMYSSVGDEERRRAAEINAEREQLEYQQFNNNDITATMENPDGTLGVTQTNIDNTDPTPRMGGGQVGDNSARLIKNG